MEEIQLRQYQEAHNKQAQAIGELKEEMSRHKHLAQKSAEAIQALAQRLRNRLTDDMHATPGDRAALLDADLVLAEAYKLTQKEVQG